MVYQLSLYSWHQMKCVMAMNGENLTVFVYHSAALCLWVYFWSQLQLWGVLIPFPIGHFADQISLSKLLYAQRDMNTIPFFLWMKSNQIRQLSLGKWPRIVVPKLWIRTQQFQWVLQQPRRTSTENTGDERIR